MMDWSFSRLLDKGIVFFLTVVVAGFDGDGTVRLSDGNALAFRVFHASIHRKDVNAVLPPPPRMKQTAVDGADDAIGKAQVDRRASSVS